MRPTARTLAVTTVALLLFSGGAWACCDSGLVDCCESDRMAASEHCSGTQAVSMIAMDCGLDHALTAATGGNVSVKPLDPLQVAGSLAPAGSPLQTAGASSDGMASTTAEVNAASLFQSHAILRL